MAPKLQVTFITDEVAKEVKMRFSQHVNQIGFDGETAIKAGVELIRRGREIQGKIIVPMPGFKLPEENKQ